MKFKAFFSTFLLSYIFWILFLAQDFNIFKLGYEELITGLVVAVVVGVFCSQFFVKKDGFWLFKKFRLVNLLIFIPIYSIELIKANWDVAKKEDRSKSCYCKNTNKSFIRLGIINAF